jgi:hypothetical protein
MTASVRTLTLFTLLLGCLTLTAQPPAQQAPPPADKPPTYRLSGPYTQDNLTIFLIHGDDLIKNKTFITLDEALEQKKVIVHETKEVNQLTIENVSPTEEVFVQAGDIVKGGQQDRLLAFDMIVAPKSGKVPINSFCVEQGRWSRRGGENVAQFNSSKDAAATKDLKLACRSDAQQGKVWDRVASAQQQLSKNVGAPVQAMQSATSLQLSLENKKLLETVDAYIKKLSGSIDGKTDVIGYAFAINGQVNSADVYASNGLFKKLWPKLIKATAVEAVAELTKDKKVPPVTSEMIQAFLADAEKGKKSEKEVTKKWREVKQETQKNILFTTCDPAQPSAVLRRSYIAK